jgi:riboflavin synthase
MFTGIIHNTGIVENWRFNRHGGKLTIASGGKFKKIKLGESIAINGCCLTVVAAKKKALVFDVSDETLRKTVLGKYQKGKTVNLERALRPFDRLGGHFVLGHVDGVGKIESIQKKPRSIIYRVSYPKKFARLLIEKGSVAVDGISLTVCDLKKENFGLYVIPHTMKVTHLGGLKVGDLVNLEFDVLGKYVHGCA